jgi:S-disulfanyl-L-cysteine oxidoreductase SoxD
MRRFIDFAAATTLALVTPAQAQAQFPGVGRAATPAEIRAWDIDVRPDFRGLPAGSGSVADGQKVWDAKCASCHGTFGESNEVFTPLIGGTTAEDVRTGHVAALRRPDVARTSLMKLATLSTLWDYVNRAMPWNAPKSLSTGEVYAVVAYMLHLADIVPADFVLSDRNIAQAQQRLPNRNGLTRDHGLWDVRGKADVQNTACMRDCATQVTMASVFPDWARGSHGDLSQQNRSVGPVRGDALGSAPPADALATLAKRNGCLSCHGIDKRLVGPAFRDVAARYKTDADAETKLVTRVRKGGSGTWGPLVMPPYPDMPDADALALVRWVLAQ